MARKKRGRPPVYSSKLLRRRIAKVAEDVGLEESMYVLQARNGVVGITKVERERAAIRRKHGLPKPFAKISMPTISKFCKENGVTFERGRRPAKAA